MAAKTGNSVQAFGLEWAKKCKQKPEHPEPFMIENETNVDALREARGKKAPKQEKYL